MLTRCLPFVLLDNLPAIVYQRGNIGKAGKRVSNNSFKQLVKTQAKHLANMLVKNGKTNLAHTLNGSSLALPRVLASIIENFQTDKGILIPKVLHKYTGFSIIN